MILGIGTDLANIERIQGTLDRFGDRFRNRVFTEVEQQKANRRKDIAGTYAKRWAAKEACSKALGTGIGRGVSWQDIRIDHDANGAPLVVLSGGALAVAQQKGGTRVALSLADEIDCVVAFAVLA